MSYNDIGENLESKTVCSCRTRNMNNFHWLVKDLLLWNRSRANFSSYKKKKSMCLINVFDLFRACSMRVYFMIELVKIDTRQWMKAQIW